MKTTVGLLLLLVTVALVICTEGFSSPPETDTPCDTSFEHAGSDEYISSRIPAYRTLAGDCTYDVGTCPNGTCRYNIYRHKSCPDDGIICPVVENRKVDCGDFEIKEVKYISHCACCEDKGVTVVGKITDYDTSEPTVVGKITDYDTSEPLSAMSVSINTNDIGVTDIKGIFEGTIPVARQVVIQVTDPEGVYIKVVKVINPPAISTLNVEIKMIKAAPSVSIDPKVDNILSISGDPSSLTQGVAQLIINANSITDMAGKLYSDPVEISITAPSVSDPFTDEIGQFITVGGEALLSDGILKVDLRTNSGDPLTGQVVFRVRQGMVLDETAGRWTLAPTKNVNGRKRPISLTDDLLTQINTGNWYNIDVIPGDPRCYFKARVFYNNPADAANSATFTPGIVAYTPINQRLRFYFPQTSDLDNTCFEVRCRVFNPAVPTNVLVGLMNLSSTETVSIGAISIVVTQTLEPKQLAHYALPIEFAHTAIKYDVIPSQKDIFVNFISNPTGGFYEDFEKCKNSKIDRPAFHFIKPSLPSYEPIPEGTKICTARIKFDFSAAISDLSGMPGLTATSVWSSAGSNYYYDYYTFIQKANDGVQDFYYACIQYRCSDCHANTAVYLNIDIPTVRYFKYRKTEAEALYCYGPCKGTLCVEYDLQYQSSIEGAFNAPELVPGQNGPDFYDGTNVADCTSRKSTEAFAYSFNCFHKRGHKD